MERHEMAAKLVEKCGISYEEAGAVLLNSGCPMVCGRTAYDIVKTGFATDAAKQAHYVHTDLNEKNCKVFYGTTEKCIEAAIKGRWEVQ